MLAVPSAKHVGATVLTVGALGVVNCAEILNEALDTDVQLLEFVVVTV